MKTLDQAAVWKLHRRLVPTAKPTTLAGIHHESPGDCDRCPHQSLEADHSTACRGPGAIDRHSTAKNQNWHGDDCTILPNERNRRIIGLARETGIMLDNAFKAERQARLGTTIVTETLAQARLTDDSWERVGLISDRQ